jgi:branched-chain amino acid transport system ATP-binding protein
MQAEQQPGQDVDTAGLGRGETLLDAQSVRFAYGDLVAVWDVSVQAYAGAVTVIVGRNGAGKTTLMFGLAGILNTVSGTIRLGDRDLTKLPPWERADAGLILVPEGKRVFRELTVEDNIAVGLPRRLRGSERSERFDEAYEMFPILRERRTKVAGSLSGGQQQMLTIASALAMRPRVLLVDEPSSGLAPAAVERVFEALDEIRKSGIGVLLVEQMVDDVVTGIADEVVVIEQGRVAMRDVPSKISLADLERRLYVA